MPNPATLYWFLPLETDGRFIGTWPLEGVEPTLDYMTRITTAAEDAGFTGLLVHTAYQTQVETWVAAAAVFARTRHAHLIVAVRPNQYHPAQAAKMAMSLQNMFPGRLALNVVSGGSREDSWIGNFDDRDIRYQRVEEWLEIVHGILYEDSPYSYDGQIYKVADTWIYPGISTPIPIFFSGNGSEARRIAIAHADTVLLFAAPLQDVAREIELMRSEMVGDSQLHFGLRTHVIVRPSEEEAWKAADDLISRVDPEIRDWTYRERNGLAAESDAQPSDRESLVIAPNLWAGIGTARFGAATALVGNPVQIASRLIEYRSLGIDTFILSGYPKLDEARRFGELVMPLLRQAGM